MWKHYFTDYARFIGVGVMFFIFFVPMVLLIPHSWTFGVGFWLMDPISYFITMYQRIRRNEEALTRKNTPPSPPN
jgi:hypothetical protein